MSETVDAVVAGGSVAGACAAAALSQLGWRVLLCEPRLADGRRLAGELLQAPAVSALAELDLLTPLWRAGAVPSAGFAICAAAQTPIVLSYDESDGCRGAGLVIEHALLAKSLLAHVQTLPGVRLVEGRVSAFVDGDDGCRVQITEATSTRTVTAKLLVAADGRSSALREAAGIVVRKTQPFRMLGCKIHSVRLPREGYGHVFVGGAYPVLAYRVSTAEVRVMCEGGVRDARPPDLSALPAALAERVAHAFASGEGLSAMVWGVEPERYVCGRMALVGDAGGTVHPVTATGVAFCAQDAVRLRQALTDHPGEVTVALRRYDRLRREPMRTRTSLAPLIAETLRANSVDMAALRRGLFAYWRTHRHGRGSSLGLLSTHESRLAVLAREYAKVMGFAVATTLFHERGVRARARVLYELGYKCVSVVRDVYNA